MRRHGLAGYSGANIYLWEPLFEITWALFVEILCGVFEVAGGRVLYLPPLGSCVSGRAVDVCFEIMDERNANRDVSRIENIEEDDLRFFRARGLRAYLKSHDYVCLQKDMQELRGNKFKSKRASCNYFTRHNDFLYRPYAASDVSACLRLYDRWRDQRRTCGSSDAVYRGMLDDGRRCLDALLAVRGRLGCAGRVVCVDGRICGFTFGFPVNADIWCVLYEVTDLSVKGCAQFIFRQFCAQMGEYRFINIMDDSGLPNLRRVKMSYHPVQRVPAYNARRQ